MMHLESLFVRLGKAIRKFFLLIGIGSLQGNAGELETPIYLSINHILQ